MAVTLIFIPLVYASSIVPFNVKSVIGIPGASPSSLYSFKTTLVPILGKLVFGSNQPVIAGA